MADGNEKDKEKEFEELYTWISTIPLSKPTKNLTRCFADAVMMAEILKVHFPRYVDLHNYAPANSLTAKKENWNILNRKVLSKINMKLSNNVVHQLANCHPGAVEHLLLELRKKVLKDCVHHDTSMLPRNNTETDSIEEQGKTDEPDITDTAADENVIPCPNENSTLNNHLYYKRSMFVHAAETFLFVLSWFISWFCIGKYFRNIKLRLNRDLRNSLKGDAEASGAQSTSANINEEDGVPRHVCAQLKQELREIDDVICTLNHKVAYLESAMKLKDQRICNLMSQILQNTVESEQLTKKQANDTPCKLGQQSQNIRKM